MNFCTLFDINYLSRGLALYESIKAHHQNFHLYIYAFDDLSYSILKNLNLPQTTIISLSEFEDEDLLRVKNRRSKGEYCWTCTPSIILHSIVTYKLDHSIYIDADLYFYSNSKILVKEVKSKSILLTKHRYSPKYDQTDSAGIYCVQFMFFRNDNNGLDALRWWRERCIEWCFARCEDGKFGDQKYLDDWTERFHGVHVLENLGGGVAPWNIQTYTDFKRSPLVFYHFHAFKFNIEGLIHLSDYKLPSWTIREVYAPYIRHVFEIEHKLKQSFSKYCKATEVYKPSFFSKLKQQIIGCYNYYSIDQILSNK